MDHLSIFKKAYKMYHGGFINESGKSKNKVYYDVEDIESGNTHSVTITHDEEHHIISLACTCTIQSLKIKHLPLCSHEMTAVMRAVNTIGKTTWKDKE